MLEELQLPVGVALVRTTAEFDVDSIPPGLRSTHRIAPGVWGRLCVRRGTVAFRLDSGPARTLRAGDTQVIEPGVPHHVEPGEGARFVIEFYR